MAIFFVFCYFAHKVQVPFKIIAAYLDSREMFASATAALRTPPCLFPYVGAQNDYMKYVRKYVKNIRLPSSSCPPVSCQFIFSLSLYSSSLSTDIFSANNITHLLNLQHRPLGSNIRLLWRRERGRGSSMYVYIVY